MPRWLLAILLVISALIAATPSLYWLAGRWINAVDERWMELLGASVFTVPIGLFLASIVLLIHGVLENRRLAIEVADLLAEEYEQAGLVHAEEELVTAGAPASTGARGGKGEPPSTGDKAKKGAAKTAKRTKRRVQSRGKSVARREMRKVMPRI